MSHHRGGGEPPGQPAGTAVQHHKPEHPGDRTTPHLRAANAPSGDYCERGMPHPKRVVSSLTLFDEQTESEQKINDEIDAGEAEQQLQRNGRQLETELSVILSLAEGH